jgi:hypothetical protein
MFQQGFMPHPVEASWGSRVGTLPQKISYSNSLYTDSPDRERAERRPYPGHALSVFLAAFDGEFSQLSPVSLVPGL